MKLLLKLLLKIFRNGLGAVIAFLSWIIPPSKIQRSFAEQKKVDLQTQQLELYQFFGCPFCIKTRRAGRRLNLKIIIRNAQTAGKYRDELTKAVGKIQVPCLKITDGNEVKWLLESGEIIAYLEKRFA